VAVAVAQLALVEVMEKPGVLFADCLGGCSDELKWLMASDFIL